jgi:lysophospholipase L1-like esterase
METNGFPFTFVGRQASLASAGFSKVQHEDYCGAVVAPPGAFGAHQYSTTDNYLQNIVRDALASSRPDVAMILIGANDIGRGRNPYQWRRTTEPPCYQLFFPTLRMSTSFWPRSARCKTEVPVDSFTTRMPRTSPFRTPRCKRSLTSAAPWGQKVFLADMFSAVDYNLMFNPDPVHPNALGLQSIAREWLARLQAITIRTNLITSTSISGGASWKYNDTGQDLGTNWAQINYDDNGWSNGVARLGYGDPATATTVSFGPQSTNKFVTTYFRRSFVVPWNVVITNLNLRVARADGAVVWLNGQDIYRGNLPAVLIASTNVALSALTMYTGHIFYPTNVPVSNLPAGTNWIAVEVHLSSVTSSAMGFDVELIGSGFWLAPPPLSITSAGDNNVALNWPLFYGSRFSLYSTTNLNATDSWTLATGSIQTGAGQNTVTQSVDSSAKFFRLGQL